MPNCKKCAKSFPNRLTKDGKKHDLSSRSYCLDCSPFRSKKGYENRKKTTEENRPERKTCAVCNKESPWNKNNVCSTCRSKHTRYNNKIKLIQKLGNQCSECGENNIDCLQFHHTDPKQKSFTISGELHCSFEKLEKEAKKCVLLCANCHSKEHAKDKQPIIKYYEN